MTGRNLVTRAAVAPWVLTRGRGDAGFEPGDV